MISRTYTTLLFDLDNTLLDFDHSESRSLTHIHEKYFCEHASLDNFTETYTTINQKLWALVTEGRLKPSKLSVQRFQQLLQYYDLPHCPKEISHTYKTQLGEATRWYPQAEASIHTLKTHYKIGIITNGITEVQRRKCTLSGIENWCDCIIISDEVGMAKPDAAIFHLACEQLQAKPHDCLMIGDSLVADYCGARNANMDFCWMNPMQLTLPSNFPRPRYTIQAISEILTLLQTPITIEA